MWNCVRRSGRPDINLRRRGSAPPASRSRGACPRCLAFLAASYPKAGPAHSTAALHVGRVTNEPTTFGQNEPKIFRMRAPKAEARHFIPAARPSFRLRDGPRIAPNPRPRTRGCLHAWLRLIGKIQVTDAAARPIFPRGPARIARRRGRSGRHGWLPIRARRVRAVRPHTGCRNG